MGEQVKVLVDASEWAGQLKHTWNYIGYDESDMTNATIRIPPAAWN